jgi:hypothetical protein|tara:strand:- start:1088 stop:1360 length:273 start_codon:yes stop_codon:yes gene_type:complete
MAASIFAKTATATGTLQGGRTRLKAFIVKTASSGSPQVVFKNGSGGATQLDVVFNTSDWVQVSIPDHGVIFDDECHITLTNITSITGMFG